MSTKHHRHVFTGELGADRALRTTLAGNRLRALVRRAVLQAPAGGTL